MAHMMLYVYHFKISSGIDLVMHVDGTLLSRRQGVIASTTTKLVVLTEPRTCIQRALQSSFVRNAILIWINGCGTMCTYSVHKSLSARRRPTVGSSSEAIAPLWGARSLKYWC
eukprot:584161-Amphidinium_carterae.2